MLLGTSIKRLLPSDVADKCYSTAQPFSLSISINKKCDL